MKPMSSQLTREFWRYLQDQVELHEQAYCQTIHDHAYRDEMRAAAETYGWLAKEFSIIFPTAVSGAGKIEDVLTAEGTSEFLNLLDQKIQHFTFAQEQTQHKKQEALAQAPGWEYYHVRRIYNEMGNLLERESTAYRDSRERFLSILEKR
ncbi:MAG TPA: hypothetical protein VK206_23540 [Anaerolineales bacterium]|nr:hypothetical protein [Anaerolineales bacterium]